MEVWKFNITSDESRLFIVVRFSVHFQALLILVGLGYAGIAILLLLLPINVNIDYCDFHVIILPMLIFLNFICLCRFCKYLWLYNSCVHLHIHVPDSYKLLEEIHGQLKIGGG
jgi:hypothetical protein